MEHTINEAVSMVQRMAVAPRLNTAQLNEAKRKKIRQALSLRRVLGENGSRNSDQIYALDYLKELLLGDEDAAFVLTGNGEYDPIDAARRDACMQAYRILERAINSEKTSVKIMEQILEREGNNAEE